MASDDDFFVVRRFGELSARVLLRMQDRIVVLEEDLQRMDQMCIRRGYDNGTFRYDPMAIRSHLMDELTSRLGQYRMPSPFHQDADSTSLTCTRKILVRSCATQGPS